MRECEFNGFSCFVPSREPVRVCGNFLGSCLRRSTADFDVPDKCRGLLVNCTGRGNDGVDNVEVDTFTCDDFGPSGFMEFRSIFMVHEVPSDFLLISRPVGKDLIGTFKTRRERFELSGFNRDSNGGVVEFGTFTSRFSWLVTAFSTPILWIRGTFMLRRWFDRALSVFPG